MIGELSSDERNASQHGTHYEVLRDRELGHHGSIGRHGLAVLIRDGVPAWIDARSKLPPTPPSSEVGVSRPSPVSGESLAQVVRVLTAMAMAQLHEVPA